MARRLAGPPLALPLILLLAAGFAWANSFMQDDAYIAFRYARHFAEGEGLVWYPGSNEYGYSNFLFTLLVGLLMIFGVGPETSALLFSVPAYFGAILLTYAIGRRISPHRFVALLPCLVLATHPTFSAYASGGLETSLQTCLVLAAYWRAIIWQQERQRAALLQVGIFSALAMLTRLDSGFLLLPLYAWLVVQNWRATGWRPVSWLRLPGMRPAVLLPLLATLALLGFGLLYYGHAFPTSIAAKTDSRGYIREGLLYLQQYLDAQSLVPLLLMVIAYAVSNVRDVFLWRYRALLIAALLLWLLFIVYVGGDFMEFRFLVPVLPLFYLLICDVVTDAKARRQPWLSALAVILMLFGNARHAAYDFFRGENLRPALIEPIGMLDYWVNGRPLNWVMVGKTLRKQFGDMADPPLFSITAAGAVPFYSGLPFIDQLGLNTRAVLLEGNSHPFVKRAGHRVRATERFLRESRVNVAIDHPVYVKRKGRKFACLPMPVNIIPHPFELSEMLLIPMRKEQYLVAHYLNPHPAVEEKIAQRRILKVAKRRIECGKKFAPPIDHRLRKPF